MSLGFVVLYNQSTALHWHDVLKAADLLADLSPDRLHLVMAERLEQAAAKIRKRLENQNGNS